MQSRNSLPKMSIQPNRWMIIALALALNLTGLSVVWAQTAPKTHTYNDAWGPAGLSISRQTGDRLVFNFSLTHWDMDLADVDGKQANVVRMPGVLLPNDAGAPDLPGISHYLALPNGSGAVAKILDYRTEVFHGVDLAPAPEIPLDTQKGPLVYAKNRGIYSEDKDYPLEPFQVGTIAPIRGVEAAMIGVTPFQYNPVQKTLTVYRDLKLEVVFEGGDGTFGEARLRNPWFDPILHNLFLNSSSLPTMENSQSLAKAGLRTPDFEYVIITPAAPEFQAWADTLRRFRAEQGIHTGVFTTEEIGGNNATAIENFIDDAYANWDLPPVAVLLMGDHGGSSTQVMAPTYDSYCISDNIYADISGNHMPDLVLARMAAANAYDLETYVHKAMDYENNPPTNADFYGQPIIAGGWQTDRWFVLCDEVVHGFMTNELGKTPTREYAIYEGEPNVWSNATNTATVLEHYGPDGLGYLPATPDHLTDWGANATRLNSDINNGAFMLLHRDHGNVDGWGEPDYTNTDLSGLNNDELPFVFSINCFTGKFDDAEESFAEAFMRHDQGALGLIAATEESFSFVNDTYVWGMIDYIWPDFDPSFGNPGNHSFLPAFANVSGKYFLQSSSWPYNTEHKEVTYYLFHHHGDAFTRVISEVPTALNVVHGASLISGYEQFEVTADAGAMVGLSVDGQLLNAVIADGTPMFIDIPGQIPGQNLIVTVTQQNHLRYRQQVPIVPANGSFVVFDHLLINDSAANGNGNLDFAEEVTLSVALHNVGLEMAVGASAVISSDDPYLTILDDTQIYGDIPADGFLTVDDGFRVRLAANVPDGHPVPVSLVATDADSTYLSGFQLIAHAPQLKLVEYAILDDPDSDGVLDPGEEATLQMVLTNEGTASAVNLSPSLSSLSPHVVVSPASFLHPVLAAGESLTLDWTVTATPTAPIGEEAEFQMAVAADNFSYAENFSLTLGLSFEDFESGTLLRYPWVLTGDEPWEITELLPGEGVYSARSGFISDNQESAMAVTVDVVTAGEISFLAKVSCEGSWDYMRFYIDNTALGQWSGNFGWEEVSFPVTSGTHTFKWSFSKDNSNAAGLDCGLLDSIVFPAITAPLQPAMVVNPGSLNISLNKPDAETHTLTLANNGEGELNYQMAVYLDETPQTAVPNQRFKKDQSDNRAGLIASRNTGGPDAFGYIWRDSDETGGPTYDWVEINAIGTEAGTGDDAILGPFALGFEFPYYGVMQDEIRICSNGWLSFTSTSTSYNNQGIPNQAEPNDLLAVFWDDLNANAGGKLYYYNDVANERFIVEFDGVYHFGTTIPLTFQVIINADGSIVYQYKTVSGVTECTVGIEDGMGNDGLQLVFNSSYLHDELAIMFAYEPQPEPWMSIANLIGTVNPMSSGDVQVLFNSLDVDPGQYHGSIAIHTNDPFNTQVDIPVVLNVSDGSVSATPDQTVPIAYNLGHAHPNPFNPSTTIQFAMPENGAATLRVYDLAGRLVRTLVEGPKSAGFHTVIWNGQDNLGQTVPSGMYFYRLQTDGFQKTRKMLLVK